MGCDSIVMGRNRDTLSKEIKVLLIDDEVDFLELVKGYLDLRGFKTFIASDASAGLSKFKHKKPDIVICDLIMPGRDGYDVISHIRNKDTEIPIIILSIIHDFEGKKEIYKEGNNYYMSKPVSMKILEKHVKEICGKPQLTR